MIRDVMPSGARWTNAAKKAWASSNAKRPLSPIVPDSVGINRKQHRRQPPFAWRQRPRLLLHELATMHTPSLLFLLLVVERLVVVNHVIGETGERAISAKFTAARSPRRPTGIVIPRLALVKFFCQSRTNSRQGGIPPSPDRSGGLKIYHGRH